jgi:2-polyprenyl-3-methyl-5-hydroxy-6-metoxy-1,4-benzoquinol methylase
MRDVPDIHSSTQAYAQRFAGAIGAHLLAVQTAAVLRMLAPWRGATVLDVGGGHGQLVVPLALAGFRVTVLGSDASCFERPRRLLDEAHDPAAAERVNYLIGDVSHPERAVKPGAFTVATCFRILPHVGDWRALVAGLSAAAGEAVLVDHPIRGGFNALSGIMFGLKKRLEHNSTRPFTMMSKREVAAAFAEAGFAVTRRYAQFFWPMALHRTLQSVAVCSISEAAARGVGLTAWAGSPVITLAQRRR